MTRTRPSAFLLLLPLLCIHVGLQPAVGGAELLIWGVAELQGWQGPAYQKPPGHAAQKDHPHPVGHVVGAGGAVVHVEDEDGDDDGEGDEDHGEEQVLADEWDDQRGGRDDLRDEQQEDGEREQHGDAERDLLAAVGGQVEDEHREAGDEQAGDDEVDGVEERQATDDEVVGDVRVDLGAAVVLLGVVGARGVDDGPLTALPVVLEVYRLLHLHQVDLGLVIRPGAELHLAVLLVEGEEGDVNAAGALVDGGRYPVHGARGEEVGLGHVGHHELPICTAERRGVGGTLRTPGTQARLLQITLSRGTPITQPDQAKLLGFVQDSPAHRHLELPELSFKHHLFNYKSRNI